MAYYENHSLALIHFNDGKIYRGFYYEETNELAAQIIKIEDFKGSFTSAAFAPKKRKHYNSYFKNGELIKEFTKEPVEIFIDLNNPKCYKGFAVRLKNDAFIISDCYLSDQVEMGYIPFWVLTYLTFNNFKSFIIDKVNNRVKFDPECDLLIGNENTNASDKQYDYCSNCHRHDICYEYHCKDSVINQKIYTDGEILIQIKDYFKKEYPDSDMASKEYDNLDPLNKIQMDELFINIFEFCKFYLLPFCGCGWPDGTAKAIRDYLQIVNDHTDMILSKNKEISDKAFSIRKEKMKERFGISNECENPIFQYFAYDLDNRGLTDHGSNITGSWITDLGKVVLYIFKLYFIKEENNNE